MKSADQLLLWVVRIGVFLIPFVPLVVSASMFFPFITGKGFAFRIITEIIFGCWLLLALREPLFRPKKSPLFWAVVTFIGIVFVADLFAINPFKAFWSNFERMEGFVILAHLLAYFLVVSSVLNAEKWWYRFFATSVGVSAFLGIYGILQLAGKIVINQGGVRLDGTFGNAAYFAGYMLFHVFLTLFLIARHKTSIPVKWMYGGAIVLQIFTLIFTATRGSGLGLICGLFLISLLVAVLERQSKSLRTGAGVLMILLALLVGGMYTARTSDFIRKNQTLTRFASISVEAAGPRLMVWGMAWQGFKENPLLGWGQEGFNNVFNKYYNPNMWAQEQWFDRTHNIFFDWLISAGLPGLLAYLSLFYGLIWLLWKGNPTDGGESFSLVEKSILTGLLGAYVIHNFFVFDNLVSYILFFSLIAFMHTRFGRPFSFLEKRPVVKDEDTTAIAGSVILIAVVFAIYALNVRPISVSRNLIEGLRPQAKGITENLAFYRKVIAKETLGTQEVAEQTMQSTITVVSAPAVSEDIKKEFLNLAVLAMNREIARAPTDTRLYMFMGGFLNRLGKYAEALPYLEKAHQTSPAKQTTSFELASTYLSMGENTKALTLLKQAFESAPEFSSARRTYAVSAIYAGELTLVDTLLSSTTDVSVRTDESIVKAYYDTKQYPKVIALLKLRLETDPSNPQTHISLAATYFASGNRNEAIKALKKAIELKPDFKAQGEHYINEIKAGRNP